MGKTVFDLYKVKILILNFTSFLALKKSKNTFPPVADFKKVFKQIFFVEFRATAQIFRGLATKERSNIQT